MFAERRLRRQAALLAGGGSRCSVLPFALKSRRGLLENEVDLGFRLRLGLGLVMRKLFLQADRNFCGARTLPRLHALFNFVELNVWNRPLAPRANLAGNVIGEARLKIPSQDVG
jgi:hypothetical protein